MKYSLNQLTGVLNLPLPPEGCTPEDYMAWVAETYTLTDLEIVILQNLLIGSTDFEQLDKLLHLIESLTAAYTALSLMRPGEP